MSKKIPLHEPTYLSSLNEKEKQEIKNEVNFKLKLTNFNTLKKMTVVGGLSNALGGMFVIWILYNQVNHAILLNWFIALVAINIINIGWSGYFGIKYKEVTFSLLKKWLNGLHVILAGLCLTWGSIGILFVTDNLHYQLFVITFLQIAALNFSFGSLFDFTLAVICITCLLLPSIGYQFYKAAYAISMAGQDYYLNIAFGISLFILGGFLLIVCYIGYKLIISQGTLSFLNEALNEKLDNMNKFLEQRVKERTIELEHSLQKVTHQATHDLLTDLPNQRLLVEFIQSAIKASHHDQSLFAVVCFSINEIGKINNGLGYQAGDLVIKTIAQRFQEKFSIYYKITLSRQDTFVILLNNFLRYEEVEAKAEEFFSILDKPIYTEKQTIKLTASIGITLYPRDGTSVQSLLMNADAAMLIAKQQGGNSLSIYKSEINADVSKQLEIESSLHDAIKNHEFILQYQPVVDLKTGKICGMEALVRWHNPILGFISPMNFIPQAETNGIILPLGEWVLRTACEQTSKWHAQGFTSLKVAVNLSSKQLQQKDFLQRVVSILEETQINPEYLELELTETEAFKDDVIPVLKQLNAMGLSLSIDDFGTGYSGLSNLKLFSIDKLKIDKSFIQDIGMSDNSNAIVSNTINLAKKLKITVLAEGVETHEQLEFLKKHGCDLIQGYYFSAPISAEDFFKLLQNNVEDGNLLL